MRPAPSVLRQGVSPQLHQEGCDGSGALLDTLYKVLGEQDTAWLTADPHGELTETPFLSRSPDDALTWICGNSDKKAFL